MDEGNDNNNERGVDQPIPILRFHPPQEEEEGEEGGNDNDLSRLRAGRVDHPPLLYGLMGQGGGYPIPTDNDNDTFGLGQTVPVDNAIPGGRGCGGCGRGGGGGCGRGGGGSGDPEGDHIDPNLTLASVGGLPEHVGYLKRAIIYPLIHKDAFKDWAVEPPKGILFHGPPGTGKTLLAKAMANEMKKALGGARISFFYQKGCESNSQYFGESEENLRALFNQAIESRPSIIFLDEIDGLCPDRDKAGQVSEAYVGVVTALLGLIDSVKRGEVFLIGATNRLDAVDAAIRRPGRFDKDLPFALPNAEGRKTILGIHTQKWFKDAPDEELREGIANLTVGFSGADIQKLCRETLAKAITRCGPGTSAAQITVTQEDWGQALEGMGPSRSDVLGSTVIFAKPPLPIMLPLVQTVVQEIVLKIQGLLSTPPTATNGEGGGGLYPFTMAGMRSFLVWEQELESEIYLNHVILNGVLSHPSLSRIPLFSMDKAHFAERVNNGSTPVKAAGNIIRQALTCNKPCVLFVPGINWMNHGIAQFSGERSNFSFVKQLQSLAGSQVILIATFIGRQHDMCPELKSLFTSSGFYGVRKPDKEERKAFFGQIFSDLIIIDGGEPEDAKRSKPTTPNGNSSSDEIGLKPEMSKKFERNLQVTVDLTINDPCDFLLKLYDTLRKEKVLHTELNDKTGEFAYKYDELNGGFEKILDLYERTRLQD